MSRLLFLSLCQKRRGLQMSRTAPTWGARRSSLRTLSPSTTSASTNQRAAWSRPSEKQKTSAELRTCTPQLSSRTPAVPRVQRPTRVVVSSAKHESSRDTRRDDEPTAAALSSTSAHRKLHRPRCRAVCETHTHTHKDNRKSTVAAARMFKGRRRCEGDSCVTLSSFPVVKVAFLAEQLHEQLPPHLFRRVILYSMLNLLFLICTFLAFCCGPTTMALLVTDSQWFLCRLEANSQHLWRLRRPVSAARWRLAPALSPSTYLCLIFAFFGSFVINVSHVDVWLNCPKPHTTLTPEVRLFRYLQSVSRVQNVLFFSPLFFVFFF